MKIQKTKKIFRTSKIPKDDIIYLIILFKIGTRGMSKSYSIEYLKNINDKLERNFSEFGNIKIKNLVLEYSESNKIDVQILYPSLKSLKKSTNGLLTKIQERKLKIFDLLNDL